MTQPILFKNGISIALLAIVEIIVAGMIATSSIFIAADIAGLGQQATASLSVAALILCLLLVRHPSDAGYQLSVQPGKAALIVLGRFLLGVVVLLCLGIYLNSPLTQNAGYWFWVIATAPVLTLATYLLSKLTQRLLVAAANNRKAVFAGYNSVSSTLASRVEQDPSLCLKGYGFFDDRSAERLGMKPGEHLQGSLAELPEFVKSHGVDVIFIALPVRNIKRVVDLLDDLRDTTASIYYAPDIFVFDLIQSRSTEISDIPVIAMCETPFYGYRGISKRLLDVTVSALAITLLSPILVIIAMAIKITSPGSVIFRQKRYGLDGSEIAVYKFRSMRVTEDGPVIRQAQKGDSRITPIGNFLRRSSLDELPQLFNVLQGKMSLVGPRPHAVAHNELYRKLIKGYMLRHKVPPGITGLAQINGCRGETTRLEDMEARVKFDIEYLRHWSLWLDVKIIFLTAFKIFRDKQAY